MSVSPAASSVRTVADLVSSRLQVEGEEVVARVVERWEQHPDEDGMAVVEQDRVRYLSRARFFHQLGKKFGYSLFENRPVALLAEDGSTVDAAMDPIEVISLASQREPERVFDHILVLEGGRFVGLVSMRDLLVHHRTLLVTGVAERAQLEEQNRALGARTRLQDELVGGLTRELRAPLNTLVALARSVVADAELPPRHRAALEAIAARAGDVLGFVNDLSDLARLDGGELSPFAGRVLLEPLLRDVLADARRGQRAPAAVTLDASAEPVLVDAEFVRRIAASLLDAAGSLSRELSLAARARDGVLELRFELAGVEAEALGRLLAPEADRLRSGAPAIRVAVARGLTERLGGRLERLAPPAVGFAALLPAPAA